MRIFFVGLDDNDNVTELETFLAAHGLSDFLLAFTKEKITSVRTLCLLEEDDLKELKIPLGPRRMLLQAIRERNKSINFQQPMFDMKL